MGLQERLIQYIEYKNLSVQTFEKMAGMSNASVKKMTNNTRKTTLDKLSNSFPDLNIDWLTTGYGAMLKSGDLCISPKKSVTNDEEPTISQTIGVPYYNVDFLGGFDLMMNDQTQRPEYLIDFKKYNEADCWCNVTGHSMEPEITHGDIIAMKEIQDTSFIPYGEVYAIVANNGMRTIKRIGPGTNADTYSLIPTNKSPEYGIQEIPKKMVKGLWKVLGCMKRL